jgi:phosphoribosylamine---glycine ligase
MNARILVVGGGGREHALAAALSTSAGVGEVLCAPGNAGIAAVARCLPVDALDLDGVVKIARDNRVDLVVVGPEAPLCAGLVDRLAAAGVAAFGPTEAAARLEGSKSFAKYFMKRHRIPTAGFTVHEGGAALTEALSARAEGPVVLKADGLAAGKGVRVCASRQEALAAVPEMLDGSLGDAARSVLVEECLIGEEVSFHVLCDGTRIVPLDPAQDHKRLGDGDRGPNTGGMGAYAPAPVLDAALRQRVLDEIALPTVRGMAEEGTPLRGVLFIGLMIVAGEPLVLEYNVRFGDPETQAILPRIDGDLAGAFAAAARGDLSGVDLRPGAGASVVVVLASAGYPASARKGDVITGLDRADRHEGVRVYHAGTARNAKGAIVTAGGRVLGVAARGATVTEAARRAYGAVAEIHFDGMLVRHDIGRRAIERERDA